MSKRAEGKTVAILAADGFEEVELTSPKEALENAGASTVIVSLESGEIQANQHRDKGIMVGVDKTLDDVKADDFDALLIPGGLFNPDTLRQNQKALDFTSKFFAQAKPVFSICHGPQVLISAGLVEGREMTGFAAIQQDLKNAGAVVRDEKVVVDKGLVTSRNPDDLPAFNDKIVEELCEVKHEAQKQSVEA
ncbi:type 1 glutamine amidotransferase [Henriciella barbarensis]|uniref:Type 1 glutamine amidotransferase n=1 Tax=Henriciella barbarensis TaxID=86342 RepID=A0A399R1S5_9PROT|nr:type 1 glutamine amidotransferase domain-containing protein [Henriciella barbarensis]RIJ23539.1 type 1 glutamine amidotransferase [Henriciella barbarensis]